MAMNQFSESVGKWHPQGNVYYDDISQVLSCVVQQQQKLQLQQQQLQQNQQQLSQLTTAAAVVT